MDVTKTLFGVVLIFGLTACSNTKTSDSVFGKASASCVAQKLENKFIVEWENGAFSVERGEDKESFKRDFIEPNLQEIRHVEHDYQVQIEQVGQSDILTDPQATATSNSWGQQMIEAPAVWNQGFNGQGVLVGVVDSEVDINHPQLAPRIALNQNEIPGNGIDDDGNGYVDDYYPPSFVSEPTGGSMNKHGSHVAGIIAADQNFGSIRGVASSSKILPAPFITNTGSGSLGDAIVAMNYVASRGAKVINASWGGAPCVAALGRAMADLSRQGILLVVAAGNSGNDLDRFPEYPASYLLPSMITVSASNSSDFMPSWSNHSFTYSQIAAPGANIYSTFPGNSAGYFDGTSMAAPFVSGAAALLWSARPNARADQIREALLSSVDVQAGHEFRVSSQGRLNVRKALTKLFSLVP